MKSRECRYCGSKMTDEIKALLRECHAYIDGGMTFDKRMELCDRLYKLVGR